MALRVVAITGPEQAELVERPDPTARDEFVVVKVHATPMCTEYKAYLAGAASDTLGHEAAGEVVEVARPGRVKVGDRVVVMPQAACGRCRLCLAGDYIHCRNAPDVRAASGNLAGIATYAQYVLKQDWLLLPVPDGLSYAFASMACCGLGPTFGAMQRLGVGAPDTVLIAGMGPVGLGGVINGTARGARVIAVESHPYRARLATDLGAEAVVDPGDPDAVARIRELTGGDGADAGLDCSGTAAGQRLLIDAIRRRGQVAFIGESGDLGIHVSRDLLRKGITLHGCWHYNLSEAPRVMTLIGRAAGKLEQFITHRFPMSRVREAWATQIAGNCGKIVLAPWG